MKIHRNTDHDACADTLIFVPLFHFTFQRPGLNYSNDQPGQNAFVLDNISHFNFRLLGLVAELRFVPPEQANIIKNSS